MIEKLKRPVKIGGTTFREKINELVEAVNELQKHITDTSKKIDDRMIGCATLDIPKSYKNDPYAEQRKWIGKLCRFSNCDGFDEVGFLTEIDPDMLEAKFRCNCHDYYEHCEPVKPDDDIIYQGE